MENKMDYPSEITLVLEEMMILIADLLKANNVNRAAQRARMQTLKLDKMFKAFRKSSIEHFKRG